MTDLKGAGPQVHSLIEIIQQTQSRRSFVHWLAGGVSVSVLADSISSAWADKASAPGSAPAPLFGFNSIPISVDDTVVVPEGYQAQVLYRWGDPINGLGPTFKPDASNSGADQELQAGMGHDGMELFAIDGVDPNQRGLLCINHEYTDQILLCPDGIDPLPPAVMPVDKVRKSLASHGVSVVEVERDSQGQWRVIDSPRARRITADTPMIVAGPAAQRLGTSTRGTVNNCSAGRTPWGTYLSCEENFQNVFGTKQAEFKPSSDHQAYGLGPLGFYYVYGDVKVPAYRWWEHHARFDLANPNNDSDRFGYVVEIDPHDPRSTPIKHTALGRIKHENAELTIAPDGRLVVYMGDDEVNQHVYKFVSQEKYVHNPSSPRSSFTHLLDNGTLYAARFDSDGSGHWLQLTPGQNGIPVKSGPDDSIGFDAADICIRTRQAAKLAGATAMDRPEWLAVHPKTGEVYVTLTNNKSRHTADAANPRPSNIFGHIVRWTEANNDPTATQFQWQIFLLGGNPAVADQAHRGTARGDIFACPDGLKFDSTGILWIQTDMSSGAMGKGAFVELGHNMMLAADPNTGETRRFLTGPRGCEITGMAMTPDRTTMFVNIQHPGEPADDKSDFNQPDKFSNWPDGQPGCRPRSATVVVRRNDGGPIGS